MSRSYYVIELSARWLTVLLVALAVLMVLAFSLGYGAAWSVLSDRPAAAAEPTPTSIVVTEEIIDPTAVPGVPEPTRPGATATPRPAPPPVAPPTSPPATATPRPEPTETPAAAGFWVQVLASSQRASIKEARDKLVDLGFDRDHQRVVRTEVAGGNVLLKLRVGPFPDRESADRVLQRMRAAGYPDAWVVVP